MSAFSFPAALLAKHTAIVGETGSGKSSTSKLMVEQLVAEGARVCILDTIKSDWWGITSSADGKRAGLPFTILGGPRGHMPLSSSAGAALGKLVAEGSLPLSILDMADFEAGGVQRFFADFAEALFRNMQGVLHLVIEEAHEVAPKERAGFGAENMALYWAKKIATGSRSKGIRLIVATQRVQKLHNDMLGSCAGLVALRLGFPADQDPIIKWLRTHQKDAAIRREVEDGLAHLPDGTGWVCSGVAHLFEKVAFPMFKTFDNSRTPDAAAASVDVKMATIDLKALKTIVGDAVKEADANDPVKLKARVAELEKKLASVPMPMKSSENGMDVDVTALEEARSEGYADGEQKGLVRGYADALEAAEIESQTVLGEIEGMVESASERLARFFRTSRLGDRGTVHEGAAKPAAHASAVSPPKATKEAKRGQVSKPLESTVSKYAKAAPAKAESGLKGSHQRVLDALAWWRKIGVDPVARGRAAVVAGYSPKASTFGVYIAELAKDGLVNTSTPGKIRLTPEGGRLATIPAAASIADLKTMARGMLGPAEARVFDVIYAAHGKPLRRADVAEAVGLSPKASTLGVYVARIASFGIIDTSQPGHVRAADWLFSRGAT